jgi:Protein of unknown function (DUF2905)
MGMGRMLIIAGAVLILAGLVITLGGRFFGVGRLPGDIVVRRQNFTFYFPIVTSLLLSVLLTIVFWLFSRR